jgi:hypothetical protein
LENTTNADYSLDPSTALLMATLPDGKGLEQRPDFTFSSTQTPAKQKVVLTISQDLDFQGDQNDLAALSLSAFTNRKLKHLDGFVMFDEAHRYKNHSSQRLAQLAPYSALKKPPPLRQT